MRVLIPTPLRSYTGAGAIEARGETLAEALADIDARFPGFRFRLVDEQDRIRRHMRVFVAGRQVFDLAARLEGAEELVIVQALSGG